MARFPAVVLLHGCEGFGPRETHWADRLRSWGYVALAVDSFTPRNMTSCAGPAIDTGIDGFAALHYLAAKPYVMPDRVAVLGTSMGGMGALGDVETSAPELDHDETFHAAAAFYPSCAGDSGRIHVPTPNATHDFDIPAVAPYQILGHHIAYDPSATQDAKQRVRGFLRAALQPGMGGPAGR
jgi:dienelactone hydrolase